jgi:hypothetical protein
MKKYMLALLLLIMFTAAAPARAALIYISPAQQHVNVGDTVSVDIFISGLAGEIVSGWDLNVLFNDTILQATDLVFDLANFMDDPDFDAIYDFSFAPGDVDSFMVSFLSDADLALRQAEPLRLFTISFLALTDGVSLLNFGSDPDFELNVVGRNGQSLNLQPRGACISVGQGQCVARVPEPSSMWLLSLAGLMLLRRRAGR